MRDDKRENTKIEKDVPWAILAIILVSVLIMLLVFGSVFWGWFTFISDNKGTIFIGFVGSTFGGLIGGLGTLIALKYSIKQTLDIQAENKEDTDKRILEENNKRDEDYQRALKDHLSERNEDIALAKKESKKQFADGIGELIGKYITYISNYVYGFLTTNNLRETMVNKKTAYANVDNQVQSLISRIKRKDDLYDVSLLDKELAVKKIELDKAEREYREARYEYEQHMSANNRLIANEAFFILKTKLKGVVSSEEIVNQITKIHSESTVEHKGEEYYGKWVAEETEILIECFERFRDIYTESE